MVATFMVSHDHVIFTSDHRLLGDKEGSRSPSNDAFSLSAFLTRLLKNAPWLSTHFFLRIPPPRFYFVHTLSTSTLFVLYLPFRQDCRGLICIPLLHHEHSSRTNGRRRSSTHKGGKGGRNKRTLGLRIRSSWLRFSPSRKRSWAVNSPIFRIPVLFLSFPKMLNFPRFLDV